MTDSRADTAVLNSARKLSKPHGLTVLVTESGTLAQLGAADCSVLLYPANALAGGLGGLWLRRPHRAGIDLISLVGQTIPTRTAEAVVEIETR